MSDLVGVDRSVAHFFGVSVANMLRVARSDEGCLGCFDLASFVLRLAPCVADLCVRTTVLGVGKRKKYTSSKNSATMKHSVLQVPYKSEV